MTRHALVLEPRDGFFCKDGRGWTTTATGRTGTLDWPLPSTVRGALRTAWGLAQEGARGHAFEAREWPEATRHLRLDVVLPLRRRSGAAWAARQRLWPAPADALHLPDHPALTALEPRPSPACTLGGTDEPALEALWRARVDDKSKPVALARWWPEDEFVAWLCGKLVAPPDKDALELPKRTDVHLRVDPETQTAQDQMLFSTDVVEMRDKHGWEWALGTAFTLPGDGTPFPAGPLMLGGDRRLVWADALGDDLLRFPEALAAAVPEQGVGGLRLIVVTPAHFSEGWRLPGFKAEGDVFAGRLPQIDADLVLRAAMVPRALPASGWDMASGNKPGGVPKPTRRLVRPGSVYFVRKRDGGAFQADELRRLWLTALGDDTDDGLGRVVAGVWGAAAQDASARR
jgi:CRISPR-associated protein Cmr3